MSGLLSIPLSGTQVNPLLQVAGTAGLTALTNAINGTNNDSRLRLAPYNPSEVYGTPASAGGLASILSGLVSGNSNILAPIQSTNGMLFPYTPTITFQQSVNYMDLALTHSNTDYQAYTRTPSAKISISGKFTVQSQAEGLYALAAIHFLRTVSKMHFGVNDPKAGLPPPVLMLSGYGNYMFNKLACILTSHSWTFDENADLVSINVGASPLSSLLNTGVGALVGASGVGNLVGGLAGSIAGGAINNLLGLTGGRVTIPAMFTMSVELTIIQTPNRMRNIFNFASFASGQLMTGNNSGWI